MGAAVLSAAAALRLVRRGDDGRAVVRGHDEYSISGAAGGAVVHIVNQATNTVLNTVTFVPTAALFVDRRESLLASLQVTNTDDYFIHLNVYPHAFWTRGPDVGVWGVVDKRARVAAGFAIGRPFGLGAGWSSL